MTKMQRLILLTTALMKKILNKYLPLIIGYKLKIQRLVNKKKAMKSAYALFATPRQGDVKPHQIEFLNAHKKEVISSHSHNIQTYHWENSGQRILFVHGWDSNTNRWKYLIEKFKKKGFDIYAFDAPAHGFSSGKTLNVPLYAKVLKDVIEKFNPDFLIGHSMGAMTVIYNQHLYGKQNIKKNVLLGAPSEMLDIVGDYQNILSLSDSFIKDLENFFEKKFGFTYEEFSMARFAKDITTKSLVIHDKNDKIAPVASAYAIDKSLKNSELVITKDFGHSLYNTNVDQKIISFIENDSNE